MSNKIEILSFDDWINVNGFIFRPEQYDLYKFLYEVGQQSKQEEIDELKKRIDELSKINESITDELVAYRSRFGNKWNRHES